MLLRRQPCGMHRRSQGVDEANPDLAHVSTSYIERQNLTMRMSMRSFTHLTNAFPKKMDNHVHARSIYFVHYNFLRLHRSLRVTPAMAVGVSDKLLSWADLIELMHAAEPAKKRGPYKNRPRPVTGVVHKRQLAVSNRSGSRGGNRLPVSTSLTRPWFTPT